MTKEMKYFSKNNSIERKTENAAGIDLCADLDEEKITIKPNETVEINTKVILEIPDGYYRLKLKE